jgi:hypothetical protein
MLMRLDLSRRWRSTGLPCFVHRLKAGGTAIPPLARLEDDYLDKLLNQEEFLTAAAEFRGI